MTPSDWLALWEEFGFDRERETEVYPCVSFIQLSMALRLFDGHSGDAKPTIEAAIGEQLMEVRDTNGELVGYNIHPGVKLTHA